MRRSRVLPSALFGTVPERARCVGARRGPSGLFWPAGTQGRCSPPHARTHARTHSSTCSPLFPARAPGPPAPGLLSVLPDSRVGSPVGRRGCARSAGPSRCFRRAASVSPAPAGPPPPGDRGVGISHFRTRARGVPGRRTAPPAADDVDDVVRPDRPPIAPLRRCGHHHHHPRRCACLCSCSAVCP